MSDYSRTTLFIVEKEDWINAKSLAEKMGYNSVSDYIFDLLRADREHRISYHSLLLELEKYYELEHYTLGLTADKAGFPERILMNLMQEFGLPFPEKKTAENTELIHKLLLENRLCPREVDSILRLKTELRKRQTLSDADILCSIFPDSLERTTEVLTLTRDVIFRILENTTLKEIRRSCEKLVECRETYSDMRSLFGKFALEYDAEALDSDPLLESLRKENCIQLFGKVVEYASLSLIKRELERIENFRFGQVMKMEIEEMKENKARIIKQKEQVEKELPIIPRQE